jgi:hypothetical protein
MSNLITVKIHLIYIKKGEKVSVTNAWLQKSLSSLSDREDSTRKRRGVYWMVEREMICLGLRASHPYLLF